MGDIAKSSLLLVPRIDNLSSTINKSIGASTATAQKSGEGVGASASKGISNGLLGSSAIFGTVSTLTSKALDGITSHIDDAVKRFDTLNRFPKTMQLLGYSADDANGSIKKMSDRLQKLPTRLDDMASLVQGLVVNTKDLGKATDAGLALNDMLIASGASQQLAGAAMEQFRQILAKGKPEMQDWRSLTQAMPGQMDQLAKAMLGPTANANDLYKALGGGKNDPIFTMDQLLDKMIELDIQGGANITSFKDQAESAAGGVQTSMDNTFNAITRGLADTLKVIGTSNISGVFGSMKDIINNFFSVFNGGLKIALPMVKNFVDVIKPFAPAVGALVASFVAWKGVLGVLPNLLAPIKTGLGNIGAAFSLIKEGAGIWDVLRASLATVNVPLLALTAGLAIATTAIGFLVKNAQEAAERQENFAKATSGLNDAVSKATSLDMYSTSLAGIGTTAENSGLSVDDLTKKIADSVDKMNETTEKAQTQISTLSTAQQIIGQYIGQTDLSTDAQGRLEWAIQQVNEQFGLHITKADVLAGTYKDEEGNVKNLRDEIDKLITKKKEEIRLNALSENLTEAYKNQAEAAKTLANSQQSFNNKLSEMGDKQQFIDKWIDSYGEYTNNAQAAAEAAWNAQVAEARRTSGLEKAEETYNSSTDAVKNYEEALGRSAEVANGAADKYTALANEMPVLSAMMENQGISINDFADDLRKLGVDTEKFKDLSNDQLLQLSNHYNGTTQSIVRDLRNFGIGMDEVAANNAEKVESMKDTFNGLGDSVKSAFADHNVDIDDFAEKLVNAGVSTEQIQQMGSENFAQLAADCEYNVGAMVAKLGLYNTTPLIDKDGNVSVNDAKLIDAQGNLYTWDGSQLIDQDGNAAIADTTVVDAQNHLWTWNGSSLISQDGQAQITEHGVDAAISDRDNWNRGDWLNRYASATVDVFRNVVDFFTGGHAAGGIRTHADGGIRPHATGAVIAHRAVPLDIVGEDGAEAIVPLTNRRYSQPFVDLIANGVNDRLRSNGNSYVINIDGSTIRSNKSIEQAINLLVSSINRTSTMGVR